MPGGAPPDARRAAAPSLFGIRLRASTRHPGYKPVRAGAPADRCRSPGRASPRPSRYARRPRQYRWARPISRLSNDRAARAAAPRGAAGAGRLARRRTLSRDRRGALRRGARRGRLARSARPLARPGASRRPPRTGAHARRIPQAPPLRRRSGVFE